MVLVLAVMTFGEGPHLIEIAQRGACPTRKGIRAPKTESARAAKCRHANLKAGGLECAWIECVWNERAVSPNNAETATGERVEWRLKEEGRLD